MCQVSLQFAVMLPSVKRRPVRETYTQITGKRREVSAQAAELTVTLREMAHPRRTWDLVLRAYDNGAALRYRFPKQEGWDALVIAGERTEFRLAPDARVFALPLNGFTSSYEKRYSVKPVKELP
jgi:hypothetical protein